MARANAKRKILIVDDESESAILRAVCRRVEAEGWAALVVQPEPGYSVGEEFEAAALWSIEEDRPDAVLLDVRFGEHRDDQFRGLNILTEIVERWPKLPILMFTQYAQGPDRGFHRQVGQPRRGDSAPPAAHWNFTRIHTHR